MQAQRLSCRATSHLLGIPSAGRWLPGVRLGCAPSLGPVAASSCAGDEGGTSNSGKPASHAPHVPVLYRWVESCSRVCKFIGHFGPLVSAGTLDGEAVLRRKLAHHVSRRPTLCCSCSEVLELLQPPRERRMQVYVDGTLGSGGHASMIMQAHQVGASRAKQRLLGG